MFTRNILNGSVGSTSISRPNLNTIKWSNSAKLRIAWDRAAVWFRTESRTIWSRWVRQYEQGLRRTQQALHAYRSAWGAFRKPRRLRLHFSRHGLTMGAFGMAAFDWNTHRISDTELQDRSTEFEYVERLYRTTLMCRECQQRRLVDMAVPGQRYCSCGAAGGVLDNWRPFLEREDLVVWRRPRGSGYEYKLYGEYDDVTAEAFLRAQLDTEYRRQWDDTAVELRLIENDPDESDSHLVYWEMQWPKLFANRDYVFVRRHVVDRARRLVTVLSRSAEHPACPRRRDAHRVTDYQSSLVVKSTDQLDSPGIQFSLTYYDEPGVSLPAAVTGWVAAAGMPDFLHKLRQAARSYVPPPMSVTTTATPPQAQTNTTNPNTTGYYYPNYYLG